MLLMGEVVIKKSPKQERRIKPLKSPSIINIFGMCILEKEKGHMQKEEKGQLDGKRTKLVLQKGSFRFWWGRRVAKKKGIFPRLCCRCRDLFFCYFPFDVQPPLLCHFGIV